MSTIQGGVFEHNGFLLKIRGLVKNRTIIVVKSCTGFGTSVFSRYNCSIYYYSAVTAEKGDEKMCNPFEPRTRRRRPR